MSKILKRKLPLLIIFLTSLLITIIWFHSGKQIAGGEESFSIFNTRNVYEINNNWEESGTGLPNPTYLVRIPISIIVNILNSVGGPLWMIQAVTYFLLLTTGGLGVFVLTKMLLNQKNSFMSFAGSLFYLLNLYSLTQIFGRFLYSSIFTWAYLPLSLYLWIRLFIEKKVKYLLLFLATSILFSLSFLQPANIITLWVPIGIWTLLQLFSSRKKLFKLVKLSVLMTVSLALWCLTNIWWVYPYLKLGNTSFQNISNSRANFDSLVSVSQYFPTSQILLLRQSFLFGKDSGWFSFYSQPSVYIISIFILSIVIFGIIRSRKEKFWPFLFILLLVGWFVSKGSNFPFGHRFFSFLFQEFPFTATLRNPYEKFGLVFLLSYSIFFGIGINHLYTAIKPQVRGLLLTMSLVIFIGILVWPMWTSSLYERISVVIPEYYDEMNNFLNKRSDSGRVLIVPINPGDGMIYSWNYQGIEPSEFLFDKPAVSKILRTPYFDNKYLSLYKAFTSDESYTHLLEEMNIKYILLHNDLDQRVRDASSSAQVLATIRKNPDISFINHFGKLDLFQYNSDKVGSLFIVDGEDKPKMTYKKINNTHYTVKIQDAASPYKLIFKETFSNPWEAKIGKQIIKNHILAYNYANGWKINKSGSYQIEVIFKVWPWD